MTLRKAAEQALEDICGAKLCEVNSMSSRAEMLRLMDQAAEALRQALAQPEQEWDSRHPAAQALLRATARLQIELELVEQLIDDPHFETMPTDMEYWGPLHDKLKEALTQPVDETVKHEYVLDCPRCGHCCQKREWVGLNYFDWTLLRTTYAPLKTLHYIKETDTDIVAEVVNDWEAFFTAIEAKLKEKNT